jgi:hypothetical protein
MARCLDRGYANLPGVIEDVLPFPLQLRELLRHTDEIAVGDRTSLVCVAPFRTDQSASYFRYVDA